jgi:hypothetical protein
VGRLRRLFKGKTDSRIEFGEHNKTLEDVAEKALYLYIIISDKFGFIIREKTFIVTANAIL